MVNIALLGAQYAEFTTYLERVTTAKSMYWVIVVCSPSSDLRLGAGRVICQALMLVCLGKLAARQCRSCDRQLACSRNMHVVGRMEEAANLHRVVISQVRSVGTASTRVMGELEDLLATIAKDAMNLLQSNSDDINSCCW